MIVKLALFALLIPLILNTETVQAASMFDDVELEGPKGLHLVLSDRVNVRAKPSTKGKKLSKLSKRDIVHVLGRVKKTQWYATQQDDKDLGFVFSRSLTPIIDASLSDPLKGRFQSSQIEIPECNYTLTYQGRAIEEETVFIAADYLVSGQCQQAFDIFQFEAMMFMSEIPPDLGTRPIYQITMDFPEVATGYEEFLSLTSLFDQTKGKVKLEGVSLKDFAKKDLPERRDALNPKEALAAAIEMQLSALNKKAWQTIAGKIPSPGVKAPSE